MRPQVLWEALPHSWQSDVTAIVRQTAETTDPELYELGWSMAGKIARILEDKQSFILDHPMVAGQVKDREKMEALLHAVAGLLQTAAESELADREAMRTLDVEKFLAGTGAKLLRQMGEIWPQLESMQAALPKPGSFPLGKLQLQEVTVLHREGGSARLRIALTGGPSTEQDWVQVEGRWVPKQMADAWPQGIAAAQRQLANSVPATSERKQALIVQLRRLDGALDGVLATKTPAEFQAAAGAAFGTMLGVAMAQAQMRPTSPAAPTTVAPSAVLPPPSEPVAVTPAPEPKVTYLRLHPVALREAGRHIGASVHVVAVDGDEFDATLLAADGRSLTLERESSAGTMTHALALQDVRALQIWK